MKRLVRRVQFTRFSERYHNFWSVRSWLYRYRIELFKALFQVLAEMYKIHTFFCILSD